MSSEKRVGTDVLHNTAHGVETLAVYAAHVASKRAGVGVEVSRCVGVGLTGGTQLSLLFYLAHTISHRTSRSLLGSINSFPKHMSTSFFVYSSLLTR